jgi:cytochrome c peroxidase
MDSPPFSTQEYPVSGTIRAAVNFTIFRNLALAPLCAVFVSCGGGDEPVPPQANRAPVVRVPVTDQAFVAFHSIDVDMSGGGLAFQDPDGDALTYELQWIGRVPGGVSFSGTRIVGSTADLGRFNAGVIVRDGRGGQLNWGIFIDISPNRAPPVINANPLLLVSAGEAVSVDALQGGATFGADPEGDAVTYSVTASAQAQAQVLVVGGTRVTGSLSAVGAVRIRVTVADAFGASNSNDFIVAMPGPEPGQPNLPAQAFVYEDARLPLPPAFRATPGIAGELGDTTPIGNPVTDAGATLGRVLFHDKRLSVTNTHACASCHVQSHGFAAATRFSEGATGELTRRNAMALAEVRHNDGNHYFWDARVRTLEALALVPIQDTTELANTLPNLVAKLAATDFYPALFRSAFGSPEITSDRIARALAQFLRSLMSYQARVDRIENPLPGAMPQAYTVQEQQGLQVAQDKGCFQCHQTTVRTLKLPMSNGLDTLVTDPGAGRGTFRPASLRNIARTAPYMHDGRFATLRDVIEHYDHGVQDAPALPAELKEAGAPKRLNLTSQEKDALEAFLHAFTDETFLADPKFSDPFQ